MAGMVQLNLFDAARENQRALQMALEGLKAGKASKLLRKILQPESLTWEVPLLGILPSLGKPSDLDEGWRLWGEFRSAPAFGRIPRYSALEMQKNHFRRLLAAYPAPDDELFTVGGLSLGLLHLLAGNPAQARRRLEEELERCGEKAVTRLHLAQANLLMGQEAAARVHFREALLQGWERLDQESIPDPALLGALRGADDPEWAIAEACIEGNLPIPRFQSRSEFTGSAIGRRLSQELNAPLPDRPDERQRQFYCFLVASENRRWMDAEQLVPMRLKMKELHPRLHALHMESLESRSR